MKHYVKPELKYEKFQLSQHVADCGWELQSGDINSCSANGDDDWGNSGNIFTTEGICVEVNEAFCYTNGSGFGLYMS